MGQHSSPEQGPFYRSAIAWFAPWVLIAVVALIAVVVAVDAMGRDEAGTPVAQTSVSPTSLPEQSPSPSVAPTTQAVTPTPAATKSKSPKPKAPLITQGISVQILNAAGVSGADEAMSDRLARLGFEVVVVETASRIYQRTTVFWSSDSYEEAARRLADRFGWVAAAKPDNLAATVSIHVVVGQDES